MIFYKITMANMKQKIFKEAYVARLRSRLQDGTSLPEYFSDTCSPPEDALFETLIIVDESNLNLKILESGNQAEADLENAIKIYKTYHALTETQASDPRLWTYLSHCTFRQYAMRRWGYTKPYEEAIQNNQTKQKAQDYYLSHWFVGSNDRALRRNALARLWWAAHLTVSPWERDPEMFMDGQRPEDPFHYTKVLFSTQDVFLQVLERGLGRDSRILIPVLDHIDKHGSLTREQIRSIMKELNLIASVRNISFLERSEIDKLLDSIIDATKQNAG